MAPRGLLPLPERLDDLEAVQFRHVDVQEQQVTDSWLRQGECLPAIVCQMYAVNSLSSASRMRSGDTAGAGGEAAARAGATSPSVRLITWYIVSSNSSC